MPTANSNSVTLEEVDISMMSMGQQIEHIRKAFYSWVKETYGTYSYECYCRDVFMEHPALGDTIICDYQGSLYAVNFTVTADGEVEFADKGNWIGVMMTYVPVDSETPSDEKPQIVDSVEAATSPVANGDSTSILAELHESTVTPLEEGYVDLVLIEPGFGNQRDNNYYPAEVLERDAHKFNGVKMYEVEHDDNQRDNRRWVSTIVEAGQRFSETGAPIVKAFIHDGDFLERAKKLQEGGLLTKLSNSIVALGKVALGQAEGKTANVVQEIVKGKFVDWVTQAGAGGHALELYENFGPDYDLLTLEQIERNRPDLVRLNAERNNDPMNETVLKNLTEKLEATQGDIKALREDRAQEAQTARCEALKLMMENTKLPAKAQERILAQFGETIPTNFKEEAARLIEAEKVYLAEVMGSGNVTGLGAMTNNGQLGVTAISLEEYEKEAAQLDRKYGLGRV